MKAIIALALIFTIAYGKIQVGGFQPQEIDSFKKSHDGLKVLKHLSDNKLVGESDVLYIEQQVVAGSNYKLALVDKDRKLHLVKVYVPLGDQELKVTKFATVEKGTQTLIGTESIQKEVKSYIEDLFTNNFDGAQYNLKSFIKFEHAVSEQKKNLVILAKYVLEGTDNSHSEIETVLLRDDDGKFEAYFHGEDKVGVKAAESGCGQYITAINCVLDAKCGVDKIQGFGKCSQLGNLRYIA